MDDPLARARLTDAAEALQTELATKLSTSLNLPFITANAQGPKHLRAEWTRARYEQLLQPVWDDLERVTRTTVADHAADVALMADRVVLAGGLARVPRVSLAVACGAGLPQVAVVAAPEELAVVGVAVLGYLATTLGDTVH
jgi:molecular chaperone DnaK